MVRRVILCSKLKLLRSGGEGKPSLKRAESGENPFKKLHVIDPKPGDLSMGRLKWR